MLSAKLYFVIIKFTIHRNSPSDIYFWELTPGIRVKNLIKYYQIGNSVKVYNDVRDKYTMTLDSTFT